MDNTNASGEKNTVKIGDIVEFKTGKKARVIRFANKPVTHVHVVPFDVEDWMVGAFEAMSVASFRRSVVRVCR